MKLAGGGFEQCYSAQVVVDAETMLERLRALPVGLNAPATLLADAGYFSEANVAACQGAQITPLIALERGASHPRWQERFAEPAPIADDATPVERMRHALKTQPGRQAYLSSPARS